MKKERVLVIGVAISGVVFSYFLLNILRHVPFLNPQPIQPAPTALEIPPPVNLPDCRPNQVIGTAPNEVCKCGHYAQIDKTGPVPVCRDVEGSGG